MSYQIEEKRNILKEIQLDNNNNIQAKNLEEMRVKCMLLAQSGLVPKSYLEGQNVWQKIYIAMSASTALGLHPILGIKNIAVINGTPSLWGEMPLSLVLKSEKLKDYTEFYFNEKGEKICFELGNIRDKVFGAYCSMTRDNGLVKEEVFTFEDASVAGLYPCNNPKKPWAKFPKRMLQMRARQKVIKDLFPDLLMGVSLAEYDYNTMPDNNNLIVDVDMESNPQQSKLDNLNKMIEENINE